MNVIFRPVVLVVALLIGIGCGPAVYSVEVQSAPMLGSDEAPHVLLVFSDFQCPFCKQAAMELKQFAAANPDRAAIYFKHFPLKQHRFADSAARAAEAARRQGKFWDMHDLIFAHAGGLSEATLIAIAKEVGLDMERFKQDWTSTAVAEKVAADQAEGEALGLWGTPFFLLDGKPFDGTMAGLFSKLKQ